MSKNPFDAVPNRRNTNCLKYDFGMERKQRNDLLPLWIADMDFKLPEEIIDELHKTAEHGIFGYSAPKEDYFPAVHNWFSTRFGWDIKPEWNIITPGIVFTIAQAIRAFTKEGEGVLIQQPVYYPFSECILNNGRKVVNNQLVYENRKYHIDFEDFEKKIVENKVGLFLLCSPHNPVGRVWTEDELKQMGSICLKHNVIVLSDEIHCDFVYSGFKHSVYANLGKEFEDHSIICTSPGKTFNIPGLQIANIIVPNERLRDKLQREIDASGYSQLNTFGIVAGRTVYEKGAEWFEDLKVYLSSNLEYIKNFLNERIPWIHLVEPEGTYLLWLDFSELGLTDRQLEELITEEAKLWLDAGKIFSKEASQFERINIACPRSILKEALEKMEYAINRMLPEQAEG